MEFEFVCARQVDDEFFVLVGFYSAEFVIEVDDGKDDAEFGAKLPQKAQERNGIRAARDSDAHAIAGFQELESADVIQNFVCQGVHEDIVQRPRTGDMRHNSLMEGKLIDVDRVGRTVDPIPKHVGVDALVCPAEQSSADLNFVHGLWEDLPGFARPPGRGHLHPITPKTGVIGTPGSGPT